MPKFRFRYLFIFLLVSLSFTQDLRFFRENIEMTVQDTACTLSGVYYFKNLSDKVKKALLYYPFVINDSLPYPDKIQVSDFFNKHILPFSKTPKAVRFTIRLDPRSIRAYKVEYRQKTAFKKMEYILTTTRFWGRPFQIAEYSVLIPDTLKLIFSSFKKFNKSLVNGQRKYYIRLNRFFPHKNFIIEWKRESHEIP